MSHLWISARQVVLLGALGAGTACHSAVEPRSPACLVPAPLSGSSASANGRYIVVFQEGVDAAGETARLSAKYGFTPLHVYETVLSGFNAQLTPEVAIALRCEGSVRRMSYDEPGAIQ